MLPSSARVAVLLGLLLCSWRAEGRGSWSANGKRDNQSKPWSLQKPEQNKAWQKPDPCSCAEDVNGPVCNPHNFGFVAKCAAAAECDGSTNHVSCHALRTVSWKNECSCRHTWKPVCANGVQVAPNTACADCLKIPFDEPCKYLGTGKPVIPEMASCVSSCPHNPLPVCSTVSGSWLAESPCVADCMGYKSFAPCTDLPHRKSIVHSTGTADVNITKRLCSSVGAQAGDVAAAVACQKVYEKCHWEGAEKPLVAADGWAPSMTLIPVCFSSDTRTCYETATDVALEVEKCGKILTNGTNTCQAGEARALFGKAVSRVCGEEPRDGKRFGFW